MTLDPVVLRDAYDAQLRAWMPAVLPAGTVVDHDGPLVRVAPLEERGFVTYWSLAGFSGDEVDGRAVEWKLHGHDVPAADPAGTTVVVAGAGRPDRSGGGAGKVIGTSAHLSGGWERSRPTRGPQLDRS